MSTNFINLDTKLIELLNFWQEFVRGTYIFGRMILKEDMKNDDI
jgi:hypothetical protein